MHLLCRALLQLEEPEFALDDSCLLHQELKLLEGRIGFVAAPSGLDLDSRENWAVRTFKFVDWVLGLFDDLGLVSHDKHQFLFCYLFIFIICQRDQSFHIDIAIRDVVL